MTKQQQKSKYSVRHPNLNLLPCTIHSYITLLVNCFAFAHICIISNIVHKRKPDYLVYIQKYYLENDLNVVYFGFDSEMWSPCVVKAKVCSAIQSTLLQNKTG